MATKRIGRDAGTGLIKPIKDAKKDKEGSIVQTVKSKASPKKKK